MRVALFLIFLCMPLPALAQEVLAAPVCFTVRNAAPYSVMGSLITGPYSNPSGVVAHHRSNFRLEVGKSQNFCTTGPLFPGDKLELTLRTLIPVFSCQTRVDMGEIVIHGRRKKEGGAETWAICY